jgi:hypothetical protein
MGHFKSKDRSCTRCGAKWIGHEEKETDVNIALWLLNEAYRDVYDEAFILSRDSDLTPAVKMIVEHFPSKKVKVISPPGAGHSKEMAKLVGDKRLASVKQMHLERALLPAQIVDTETGRVVARRPAAYDPPS